MPLPSNPVIRIAESDTTLPVAGGPNKIEPTAPLTTTGYDKNNSLGGQHFNYILDNFGEYLQYLVDEVSSLTGQVSTLNTTVSDLQVQIDDNESTINTLIPSVGDLYYTESAVSPATKFGIGTWELIEESFIVGYQAGDPDFGTVGGTGGTRTHAHTATTNTTTNTTVDDHILTEAEIPSHQHALPEGGADNAVYGTTTDTNVQVEDWNNQTTTTTRSLTKATGGGLGHNHTATSNSTSNTNVNSSTNLPPYRVVNIWKRTA